MTQLPAPRAPGRYRIAVVCTGNICRSPTADVILTELVASSAVADLVRIDSFGLGAWHVGDPMDPRSAAHLDAAGYDPTRHRARQLPRRWYDDYDLVLAMDRGHYRDLLDDVRHDVRATERVRMFRDFDPVDPGSDVPDPYYGGRRGFQEVLTMVERTSAALTAALEQELPGR